MLAAGRDKETFKSVFFKVKDFGGLFHELKKFEGVALQKEWDIHLLSFSSALSTTNTIKKINNNNILKNKNKNKSRK